MNLDKDELKALEAIDKVAEGGVSEEFVEKLYQRLSEHNILHDLFAVETERESFEEFELEKIDYPSFKELHKLVEEPVSSGLPDYRCCIHRDAMKMIPNGSLGGINFIYDEDKDERLLLACYKLQSIPSIKAVYEHEGNLTIFTTRPIFRWQTGILEQYEVACDYWNVKQYTPIMNGWEELTEKLLETMLKKQIEFRQKYYRFKL